MEKTIYGSRAEELQKALVAMRKRASLTQRQLAAKIGRVRSFVGRVEIGERRLDLVEFWHYCRCCQADPVRAAGNLMKAFEKLPR